MQFERQALRLEVFLELGGGEVDVLARGRLAARGEIRQHQAAVDHLLQGRLENPLPLGAFESAVAVGLADFVLHLGSRDAFAVYTRTDGRLRLLLRPARSDRSQAAEREQEAGCHRLHVTGRSQKPSYRAQSIPRE